MHRHFTISIELNTLLFIRDGQTVFEAKTSLSNAALVGETIPVEELALLFCPQQLSPSITPSYILVSGLKLDSKAEPDLVCKAYKAGKMHADPFPTLSTRASRPLQLVHSNAHGPVKVSSTHQGYRYWVSFIDDFSRFKSVYLLKRKSEAFGAFKQFKAWADNLTGQRMGPESFQRHSADGMGLAPDQILPITPCWPRIISVVLKMA
jgi:hypothetical protein